MPIDIEQFDTTPEKDLRGEGPTNVEVILNFLAAHADQAFRPKEIHERTGVARGSVGAVLSQLENQGYVRHRGEYWAIGDLEDVDVTLGSLATARAATDRLGGEDPDEWGPGADDREDE